MSQCSPKLPLQNADSLTVVDGGEKEKAKIPSLTVHGVKKKPLKITSKVDLKYKWEKPNCNKQKKQKKKQNAAQRNYKDCLESVGNMAIGIVLK